MYKYLMSFILALALSTSVFAGEPEDFNKAYWASKTPEVAVLASMETFSAERTAKAIELAKAGAKIDMEVDAWGSQPWYAMKNRKMYGYTWVPSILQPPVPVAPGLYFPGVPAYDPANPPVGSIKVSVDPKDYPPAVVEVTPPPVVTAVPAEPNWTLQAGGWAPVLPLDKSPNGTVYNGPKGKWVKTVLTNPWGQSAYWLQQ